MPAMPSQRLLIIASRVYPGLVSERSAVSTRRNWSLDETMMAFALYYVLPARECDDKGADVRRLANRLHRTPSSVALKIWNIAAHDPNRVGLGKVGMRHGSKLDEQVWEMYAESRDTFLEQCLQLLFHTYGSAGLENDDIVGTPSVLETTHMLMTGGEREATVMQRIHQQYFRNLLVKNYHGRCCMTGIGIDQLLVASHIKPWNVSDAVEKTAAGNGLLLNAFHDKAFDRGFITIDDDYRVHVSHSAVPHDEANDRWLYRFEGMRIELPETGRPSHRFIEYHNKEIFLDAA